MIPFFRKHILVDFLHIFLEKRTLSPYFVSAYNLLLKQKHHNPDKQSELPLKNKLYLIYDVPDYLLVEPHLKKGIMHTKVNTFRGSLILLHRFANLEELLKEKLSAKRRSQLRGYQRKLKYSFSIRTKMYFGEISREEFNFIFDIFYRMLDNRFNEKQTKNDDLPYWEKYKEVIFPLINEKRACLSVIFDEDLPISISLNIVRDSMLYGYMKSYDIDYSKFGLGFLDFINLLEWGYQNQMSTFDFLKGEYAYKEKWIDHEYYFQKHVLCNAQSLLSRFWFRLLSTRLKVFYWILTVLKGIGLHKVYHALKKGVFKIRNTSDMKRQVNFSVEKISELPEKESLIEVDLSHKANSHLKRPFYSCLYAFDERKNQTQVYSREDEPGSFIILGEKHAIKLVLH